MLTRIIILIRHMITFRFGTSGAVSKKLVSFVKWIQQEKHMKRMNKRRQTDTQTEKGLTNQCEWNRTIFIHPSMIWNITTTTTKKKNTHKSKEIEKYKNLKLAYNQNCWTDLFCLVSRIRSLHDALIRETFAGPNDGGIKTKNKKRMWKIGMDVNDLMEWVVMPLQRIFLFYILFCCCCCFISTFALNHLNRLGNYFIV